MEVGGTLVLGIHPRTPRTPVPGTKGSVTLGLVVDEPIDLVLSRLAQRGVRVAGPTAEIEDLDGNVITLWEAGDYLSPRRTLAASANPPRSAT